MEQFRKWLVGLDLSEIDHSVMRFTRMLSDTLHPEHIEFIHITHRLSDAVHVHLPGELKYPDHEELLEAVRDVVKQYYAETDNTSCQVMGGTVKFDLWRESYLKDIDLFIAGSKEKHRGRGLIPKKFVRKSFCSVLFVPQEIPGSLSKIWVPSDLSEHSGEALKAALHIAQQQHPPAEVHLQHIYQLPHTYYYEGFPREQIMEAVRETAEQQMDKLIKKCNPQGFPITSHFTPLKKSYASFHVQSEAENEKASLIVLAAGGRSRFAKLILGSETEHMIQFEKQVPLLVLKKKSDRVRLWDLVNP